MRSPTASTVDAAKTLQEQLVRIEEERDGLRIELTQLRQHLDHLEARRAQGFLAEFDYPYTPKVRSWDAIPGGNVYRRMLAGGDQRYRDFLTTALGYKDVFVRIPRDEPAEEAIPFWNNGWFPPLDAISLMTLLAVRNPRRYVEVGSGNSTKFARRAIADHALRTTITSIDPHPRAVIDTLCDQVVRTGLQNCDLEIFAELGPEDVLFIDNSHRSFQNSDVTVFFTEVVPVLGRGCHYGIHDIFLPYDYTESWLDRFYNEQYLLMTYLLGGAGGDEILLPVHYVERTPELAAMLDPVFSDPAVQGAFPIGGAFWMRKA